MLYSKLRHLTPFYINIYSFRYCVLSITTKAYVHSRVVFRTCSLQITILNALIITLQNVWFNVIPIKLHCKKKFKLIFYSLRLKLMSEYTYSWWSSGESKRIPIFRIEFESCVLSHRPNSNVYTVPVDKRLFNKAHKKMTHTTRIYVLFLLLCTTIRLNPFVQNVCFNLISIYIRLYLI